MLRLIVPILAVIPTGAALAHDGLHHHPHGTEFAWWGALIAGAVGAYALFRFGWRK